MKIYFPATNAKLAKLVTELKCGEVIALSILELVAPPRPGTLPAQPVAPAPRAA